MYRWLKWQKGRQATGYDKMLIANARWPLRFDVYVLRFPQGCHVPEHRDEVRDGRHYRLNLVLKRAQSGGEFHCADPIFETTRIKFFRPDVSLHSVTKIELGCRYVLSIGCLRRK